MFEEEMARDKEYEDMIEEEMFEQEMAAEAEYERRLSSEESRLLSQEYQEY